MTVRVVLIKIAAIGDVVVAARAMREFIERFEVECEFHWVIDRDLSGLAEQIVGKQCPIVWHPIDSKSLFGAATRAKIAQSKEMFLSVSSVRPRYTLFLHRDWRYRALLFPFSGGRSITIGRVRENELEVYRKAFEALAAKLGAVRRILPFSQPSTGVDRPSGRVGVLVGGANNQKIAFSEKKWPALPDFIRLLLQETKNQVVLFGGPEDAAAGQAILAAVGPTSQVTSMVGRLTLAQIPTALAELDAFVSIDSGLAHIAAAVMRKPHQRVVTLFGPTDPVQWGPTPSGGASVRVLCHPPACAPCYRNEGRFLPCKFEGELFQQCMKSISPREVLSAMT